MRTPATAHACRPDQRSVIVVSRLVSRVDRHGRTLRQIDFDRRLFTYPCTYMIYTAAFDALPAEARDAVYRRLWHVLAGRDPDPRYVRLSPDDRRNIIDILRDTKPDLPRAFR